MFCLSYSILFDALAASESKLKANWDLANLTLLLPAHREEHKGASGGRSAKKGRWLEILEREENIRRGTEGGMLGSQNK